jgi:GxxExxY protein
VTDLLLHKEKTYQIIGAAMAVHQYLGCGFTEKVYQDALEIEFPTRDIPYEREQPMEVSYRGVRLNTQFVPDFICFDDIIVELKAVKELEDIHRAQAINYGKVANTEVALLINFGESSLRYERYIM